MILTRLFKGCRKILSTIARLDKCREMYDVISTSAGVNTEKTRHRHFRDAGVAYDCGG